MNKEIKVGIIGVVGLVFFYLGSNFLKGIDFFSPINRYYAVYENVDGLIVANPIIVKTDSSNQFEPIIDDLKSVVKKVLPYYKDGPWNKNLWINGWVNYTKEGQYIEIHNHSVHENSYLSGTLSLTDRDDVITNFWIPIMSFSKEGGPLSFPSLVGRLLIFPSFVPHEVTKVSTGVRITIGFDLITDQAMTYFRKNSNDPKDPLSRAVKL